jgi:hypothetical protein
MPKRYPFHMCKEGNNIDALSSVGIVLHRNECKKKKSTLPHVLSIASITFAFEKGQMNDILYLPRHVLTFLIQLYRFQIDVSVNVRACYVKVEDDGMCLPYVSNFLIADIFF